VKGLRHNLKDLPVLLIAIGKLFLELKSFDVIDKNSVKINKN